jgi:hypothetical protein
MRIAWGLVAVAMLGCGEKKQAQDKAPIVRELDLDEVKPADPPPEAEPAAVVDSQPAPPDPPAPAVCIDHGKILSWDPAKLRACFDGNDDGERDRCVTWRRDGKVASIDTEFAVEEADAKEPTEPPVEYRSDEDHNDEDRITLDGNTIEICPHDRTCMRIMPKVGAGEITSVLTDPDYKRGVFLIKAGDEGKPTIEIWDLAAGRQRTRTPIKRLLDDESYDLTAKLGSGAVIVLADDTNGRALGTIFSFDGGLRGELAQGSRTLDINSMFQHAGVFGIVDVGPIDTEDKPYVLHLTSLANGSALGKITIKRVADSNGLSLEVLPNKFVGITQFGEQLRLDVLDLRTRTTKIFFAPGC